MKNPGEPEGVQHLPAFVVRWKCRIRNSNFRGEGQTQSLGTFSSSLRFSFDFPGVESVDFGTWRPKKQSGETRGEISRKKHIENKEKLIRSMFSYFFSFFSPPCLSPTDSTPARVETRSSASGLRRMTWCRWNRCSVSKRRISDTEWSICPFYAKE